MFARMQVTILTSPSFLILPVVHVTATQVWVAFPDRRQNVDSLVLTSLWFNPTEELRSTDI
jgi:hypothetical protein